MPLGLQYRKADGIFYVQPERPCSRKLPIFAPQAFSRPEEAGIPGLLSILSVAGVKPLFHAQCIYKDNRIETAVISVMFAR